MLHAATGGKIEGSKTKYFAWQWKIKQGKKILYPVNVKLKVKQQEINQIDVNKCERTIGVHIGPSLK